jgi:sugar/nucleoside kinase (ribokinase family)
VQLDLISVGDVMVDVSVDSGALRPGGDVHGEVRLRPGGAAANAAVWAAAAGAKVRLFGRVGDDMAGRLVRSALEERGVDAALATGPGVRTGTMLVVHEAGERSMVADRGANASLAVDDLPGELNAAAVLVSGYILFHPDSEAAAVVAFERARSSWVAVDAASWPLLDRYGADRFRKAADPANVLLANGPEAGALTGSEDPGEAGLALTEDFEIAVVKLGEGGALLARRGAPLLRQAAPSIREVDPTGAGDAFDGVLLSYLAQGAPPEVALQRACEAGSRAAASADPWPPP